MFFIFTECHEVLNGKEKKYSATKLGATLEDREHYVLHYMNLKTYVRLGLRLKKIHRVLAFTQSDFLKQYINQCTLLRQKATTDFGKRLWKLFSNSVFGKFIEQVRNHLHVNLCTTPEKTSAIITQPGFSNFKIISENLVAIFSKQTPVIMNKAFPVGFTILERSKEYVFQQFYEVIRPNLTNCLVTVIMSDTDSLCLQIKSKERNVDHLRKLGEYLDFSNYSSDHANYSVANANKLGYWKDELQGAEMTNFIGLRSKTYAFCVNNNYEKFHSKCKGVSKGYKKNIRFEAFEKCISRISSKSVKQFRIQAKNHIVNTVQIKKVCFTSFDDKRYILNCGIHSVPYGSKYVLGNNKSKSCVYCKKNCLE